MATHAHLSPPVSAPVPQRFITVSLIGNDSDVIDYYSYWSPVTGATVTNIRQCIMEDNQPMNSLFVLDYFSTMNGWTMTGMSPVPNYAFPEWIPGALGQSIMTHDMHVLMQTFRYYINYENSVTGAVVSLDPQQTNVPKPQPR